MKHLVSKNNASPSRIAQIEKTGKLSRPYPELDLDRTDISLIALRRILRATEMYASDLAREAGLTAVQLRRLPSVAEKGPRTPNQLTQVMGGPHDTVTAPIKNLAGKALLARHRSTNNR